MRLKVLWSGGKLKQYYIEEKECKGMQIYLENQNILCEVDLSVSLEVTAENFGRVEFCSDTEDYNIFVPIKDT